jgi:hypothetical protein
MKPGLEKQILTHWPDWFASSDDVTKSLMDVSTERRQASHEPLSWLTLRTAQGSHTAGKRTAVGVGESRRCFLWAKVCTARVHYGVVECEWCPHFSFYLGL